MSPVDLKSVVATEWVSDIATSEGGWSCPEGAVASCAAVDAAIVRAWQRLLGGSGRCEIEQVSITPIPMGNRVSVMVTVLGKRK